MADDRDEADWFREVPRSIRALAVTGLTLMAVAFGGFGAWAFTAPLSAAIIASGTFVATGRNKIVQHLEGGIISRIEVREGDVVAAGDPIVLLDRTAAEAQERELFLREIRLRATAERLHGSFEEAEEVAFSADLLALEDDPDIAAILAGQRLAHRAARTALGEDIRLLERNIEALNIRARGLSEQNAALVLRSEILDAELADKTALHDRGLIRTFDLNAIRRMQAEGAGQLARLAAELGEVRETILRYEDEIARARATYRQAALDELGPIEADLESIREKRRQASNILERAIIRAPVDGSVVRLHYHTPGGVIETGHPIAEILPADSPLIIEAQIPGQDRDSLSLEQTAMIRLPGLNQRTTPVLTGRLFYISADTVAGETAIGQSRDVYLVRISLPRSELSRLAGFVPSPGMPADIMIETEARTFAEYLWKPIGDSMSHAFREQ